MADRPFILFPGPATWRFCAGTGPKCDWHEVTTTGDVASTATVTSAAMKAAGYAGHGVVLAVPSAWCLAAPVAVSGLPAKNRRQAMVYRLEEKLPVAAEEFVADFVPVPPSDARTLGVAVLHRTLAPVVDALEANGVTVACICPASLLSLQHWLNQGIVAGTSAGVVFAGEDTGQLDLFLLERGLPVGWSGVANEARVLALHLNIELRAELVQTTPEIAVIGVAADVRAAMAKLFSGHLNTIEPPPVPSPPYAGEMNSSVGQRAGIHVTRSPAKPFTPALSPGYGRGGVDVPPVHAPKKNAEVGFASVAAASFGASVLAGKSVPWIDLRRDALAAGDPFRQVRRPLNAAFVAGVLFALCLCAAMLWRAKQYDALSVAFADQQQEVFRRAIPKGPAPEDVPSRLAAEERGLRGLSGDTAGRPPRDAGLLVLRDLMSHLPPADALRYRVLELRLDQKRFILEGQAPSHGDADAIVNSLREGGLFSVDPPRTEQLGGSAATDGVQVAGKTKGVAFTITGLAVVPEQKGGK